MGTDQHKQKIWDLILDIGTGMLVSEDNGFIHGRPMHLVQDSYDGTIWFFTNTSSEKVEEINSSREVCLTFSDPNKKTFVSMTGVAKLKKDQELINKLWSSSVSTWFPEGKDSPTCALIEIKINHGEHWSNDVSKIGYIYEITKSKLEGKIPNLGENQKF